MFCYLSSTLAPALSLGEFVVFVDSRAADRPQEDVRIELLHLLKLRVELPNVIHRPYGYYEYSEMDDSNTRFMRKQENTNTLKDDIFTQVNTEENNKKNKKVDDMKDLFESIEE